MEGKEHKKNIQCMKKRLRNRMREKYRQVDSKAVLDSQIDTHVYTRIVSLRLYHNHSDVSVCGPLQRSNPASAGKKMGSPAS